MERRNRKFMAMAAISIIFALLMGCQPQPTPELVAPPVAGIGVGLTSDSCPSVEIQAGQQVTWTNQDDHEHIVQHVPSAGSLLFDSGALQAGDGFTFTFAASGHYSYRCSTDGSLTGTVKVLP